MGSLALQEPAGTLVWRVGYRPQPWAWVGWEWASEGRFPGRWDDAEGNFRTVYAGSSLLGCLLELLADFRADPLLAVDLGQIAEVVFQSRHGDDITLWAVFERPGDGPISPCLTETTHHELHADDPDAMRAMELLGLQWHTPDASDSTG